MVLALSPGQRSGNGDFSLKRCNIKYNLLNHSQVKIRTVNENDKTFLISKTTNGCSLEQTFKEKFIMAEI